MNQTLSPQSDFLRPSRVALPSWAVSIVLHAALIALLTSVSWTVAHREPEPQFESAIMLKSQLQQGTAFRSDETTSVPRDAPTLRNAPFLPDSEPSAIAQSLPKFASVDLAGIGLSGSIIAITGNLLAVSEDDLQSGVATTEFFTAQASGSKFVYVIDRSGSMSQRDRLGAAKNELIASLEKLRAETEFQVIVYNHRAEVLINPTQTVKLQFANDDNKRLAAREMAKLAPDGGTEHLTALKLALTLHPEVVFFLTDADDLAAQDVRVTTELNRDRAKIHTIEFGVGAEIERDSQIRELARRNGGTYRYVDTAKFDPKPSK